MGEKKSKALARELIDDLLAEDSKIEIERGGEPLEIEDPAADKTQLTGSRAEIEISQEPSIHIGGDKTTPINQFLTEPTNATEKIDITERTEKVDMTQRTQAEDRTTAQPAPNKMKIAGPADDRVRASVGRFAPYRSAGAGSTSSTEAALAQSESLRIAQSRILELEQEIERLRVQNEELAAAAETLRRRTDELMVQNQKREGDYNNAHATFEQEKEILVDSKEALVREIATVRQKNEELELRISTNISKIRVRERELENRLELVKMESAALIRSKDEMILDLKRTIDQLNLEMANFRTKNQELNRQTLDKQEQLRRTVKALRLALSMLEGEEDTSKAAAPSAQRKAK